MSTPRDLLETVAAALTRCGIRSGDRVLVACSGGVDSTALAHLIMRLRAEGRVGSVVLGYIDHQLRGQTERDVDHVRALGAAGGAQVEVVPVTVDRQQASLEDAARQARHRALGELAGRVAATAILMAHTASDQAETLLMRIIRGTGPVGLAGIPERRSGLGGSPIPVVRPLLEVSRERLQAYLVAHELNAVSDPMNEDRRFLRVRVRETLLPALVAENPEIEAALCRLAAAAREQRQAIDEAAEALLDAAERDGGLCVAVLAEAPAAVAKRALTIATERQGGHPLEASHLCQLEKLIVREAGGTVSLSLPNLEVSRIYGVLHLGPPATVEDPELEIRRLAEPYTVRTWRRGDRMRPRRLKGRSRKLSDLFTDAKIPRELRSRARVVEREGEIVWAEHIGLAWGAEFEVTLTARGAVASNKDRQ